MASRSAKADSSTNRAARAPRVADAARRPAGRTGGARRSRRESRSAGRRAETPVVNVEAEGDALAALVFQRQQAFAAEIEREARLLERPFAGRRRLRREIHDALDAWPRRAKRDRRAVAAPTLDVARLAHAPMASSRWRVFRRWRRWSNRSVMAVLPAEDGCNGAERVSSCAKSVESDAGAPVRVLK